MKKAITAALSLAAGLAGHATLQAAELSDDTPVRAITIFPKDSPAGEDRIMINPGLGTLKECRETIQDTSALIPADSGTIFMCIPADLKDASITGHGLPLVQYEAP